MAAVGTRDTTPEMLLRSALHARGLRYRVHPPDIVGRPDLVNRRRRIAVFVDGDFWHANPEVWRRRGLSTLDELFPASKREFWTTKLRGNAKRDAEVTVALEASGWTVIRIWESEIRRDLLAVVNRVADAW